MAVVSARARQAIAKTQVSPWPGAEGGWSACGPAICGTQAGTSDLRRVFLFQCVALTIPEGGLFFPVYVALYFFCCKILVRCPLSLFSGVPVLVPVRASPVFYKMNSRVQDAAQTGHKRQATKTGRHVVTQGSLGDGGVLRRRGEPELGRNLFRRRELQRD